METGVTQNAGVAYHDGRDIRHMLSVAGREWDAGHR
jgi:hypothetical protein